MSERILVAGSTGALGREVVCELKRRGLTVRALGRNPQRLAAINGCADERMAADALKPGALHGVCDGVDRVFSCLGASAVPLPKNGYAKFSRVDIPANRALIAEAKRAGVKKFVYVSTFHTPNLRSLEFVRAHEAVVEELKASGLDYAIIRPTGFFSAMEEILLIASLGLLPEYAGGKNRTNPIHEADLAVICADALYDGIKERDIGGPEPLTRKQIAAIAYHAIGKPDSARRVPVSVLALAGRVLRPFNPRIAHLFTFIAKILVQDVVAPCHGTRTISEFFEQRTASTRESEP